MLLPPNEIYPFRRHNCRPDGCRNVDYGKIPLSRAKQTSSGGNRLRKPSRYVRVFALSIDLGIRSARYFVKGDLSSASLAAREM